MTKVKAKQVYKVYNIARKFIYFIEQEQQIY